MKLILAALALATPMAQPLPAITAPPAAAVAAGETERLVELLFPEDRVMETALAAVRNDTRRRSELSDDPAMLDFVITQMWPEVSQTMRAAMPELRADLAKVFTAELTPGEISDLTIFFSSPAGKKLLAIIYEDMAANPAAGTQERTNNASDRFMAVLTPDDYPAVTRFAASGGAAKMQEIGPLLGNASAAWAERLLARHGPRFATLRTQAIADYKRKQGGGQ